MKNYKSSIERIGYEKLKSMALLDPFEVVEIISEKRFDKRIAYLELKIKYGDIFSNFLVEIKNRSVPQMVEQGILQIKDLTNIAKGNYYPAIMVPYLSKYVYEQLKKNGVSGIDLNGNYYISTDKMVGIRLDRKNEYKESTPIRNIYSANSSLVGRFLLREKKIFKSVNEIYIGIREKGGNIALSTVSKVLSILKDDLIISKGNNGISLMQPDKLLQSFKNNYKPPTPYLILNLKLPKNKNEATEILNRYLTKNWILSGESSADYYTTTTETTNFIVYVKSTNNLEVMEKYVDNKFYNYQLMVVPEEQNYIFFDSVDNYASRVQTYIELMHLDKREKEIAIEVEKEILKESLN